MTMREIYAHFKKSQENIQSGNFYFKLDEQPILIFATQIKTERPKLLLNFKADFSIIINDNK